MSEVSIRGMPLKTVIEYSRRHLVIWWRLDEDFKESPAGKDRLIDCFVISISDRREVAKSESNRYYMEKIGVICPICRKLIYEGDIVYPVYDFGDVRFSFFSKIGSVLGRHLKKEHSELYRKVFESV